ncbi:glucosamine-6-phosphate deaminase [Synechococcus sp. RSCCF101]|uniref:glucosamine-6-phosphate deaminase n=1 Tax=Synechococcus sp. RSCCF101 TaxID=2511069 RepID=UPI001243E1BD|nr:glucosamine-6-phosphate deaminase [Synechococcus sp. RSCCF101]QEY33163.1 glucosamine-6-phosphate deaminase [Synechococcus sp. RSCCF101]
MDVRVFASPEALAKAVATELSRRLLGGAPWPLGLATGRTMEPVYGHLCQQLKAHGSGDALAGIRQRWSSFNLDDYVGLDAADPGSFAAYVRRQLEEPLELPPGACDGPRGEASDPQIEARAYGERVAAAGGLGLQLLGLGLNGHVAFNEPPSPRDCTARVVTLSPSTRLSNAGGFDTAAAVPARAITLGLKEILSARELWLVVNGTAKASVLARALRQPAAADCPASWLQQHPRFTVWADAMAAAGLQG